MMRPRTVKLTRALAASFIVSLTFNYGLAQDIDNVGRYERQGKGGFYDSLLQGDPKRSNQKLVSQGKQGRIMTGAMEAHKRRISEHSRCKGLVHTVSAGFAEFYDRSDLPSGCYSIFENDLPLDFRVQVRPGKPLVIFFHGANDQKIIAPPFFEGVGLAAQLDATTLHFSDSSIYLSPDMKLGWFAGSTKMPLQNRVPHVIRKVAELARASRVIMVGGSGGGYAAMYYSAGLEGSIAVAWNPQIDITQFGHEPLFAYTSPAFGLDNIRSIKSNMWRFADVDLGPIYARKPKNHVLYIQNSSDNHVRGHLLPFLKKAYNCAPDETCVRSGWVAPGMFLYIPTTWAQGHVPPKPPFLVSILQTAIGYAGDIGELFQNGPMTRALEAAEAEVEKSMN